MSIESIQYALKERFAAPLPEFYQLPHYLLAGRGAGI